MLRLILGVGGAALVALGVFGGPILESGRQAVANLFEADAVVTETLAVNSLTPSTAVQPGTEDLVVAGAAVPASESVVVKPVATGAILEASGNVAEVKASAKDEPVMLKTASVEQAVVTAEKALLKEAEVNQIVQTTAGPAADNTLFVLKERVNLREGPSIDHAIVLQLDIGQELMEFKRDGKWVHVGAYGTSGKIGWVHGTLVGKN